MAVADFDGNGRLEVLGKTWRANQVNGNEDRRHVDFLRNAASR